MQEAPHHARKLSNGDQIAKISRSKPYLHSPLKEVKTIWSPTPKSHLKICNLNDDNQTIIPIICIGFTQGQLIVPQWVTSKTTPSINLHSFFLLDLLHKLATAHIGHSSLDEA